MRSYNVNEITSLSNPKIKALVKLRDRTHRNKAGLLLIEGYRELKRALDNGVAPLELYYAEGYFLGSNEPKLIEKAASLGANIFSLSKPAFKKISYRDRPDGLIATSEQMGLPLSSLEIGENPLLVVAEAIEKPGNLGTILRSADAVDANAVIVCDPVTDINNPNVVRASTGTLFTVPVSQVSTDETFEYLKQNGIKMLAATPHADMLYTEADMTKPIAIAVGAEQYGLSDKWMNMADYKVKIPMAGVADSLNVATATTVLLFEAARQRGFPMKLSS